MTKDMRVEELNIDREELFSLGLCFGTLSTLNRVELNDTNLIYWLCKAQNEARTIIDCIEKRLAIDVKDFTYFISKLYDLLIKTECKFISKKSNEVLDLQEHITKKLKNAISVLNKM